MLRLMMAAGLAAMVTAGGGPTDIATTAPALETGSKVRMDITRRPGGLAVIAATLTPGAGTARTITLQMYDGETAVVALPGDPATRYRFRRTGAEVRVMIEH